ncbi:transposase family protein, partial [Comamonas kerstersii]
MRKDTTWLGLWEGFRVIDADLQTPGQAVLTLEPLQGSSKCSACLKPLAQVHEYVQRTVRDMPLVDRQLRLKVKLHRLVCPDCGKC